MALRYAQIVLRARSQQQLQQHHQKPVKLVQQASILQLLEQPYLINVPIAQMASFRHFQARRRF
jgi:hypothetical protein